MRLLFDSLTEEDRRHDAAIEALKLSHGGVSYIAKLFDIHRDTIRQGMEDLEMLPNDPAEDRIRKRGAVARMLAARNQD